MKNTSNAEITSEVRKKIKHYRLSEPEYFKICGLLDRKPTAIEWPLFSALWSEHCSYKSSKIHLKKFAKTINSRVVNAVGENAGVLDLGEGERVVFKMESHNHPSFIEPYQGAATGIGGILRDIFTMGARPIALADYLCFGEINAERMVYLVDGVVRGISGYGNSVGVPTVSGQTNFDRSYNKNILVNAMAVGLLRPGEQVALSAAKGVGNCVVYVGAKTGKDGVHGASMASESFDENSEAKKPNVQIGDPYYEKLLIESCLEVLQKELVVAIQDMGAAGLTSSSFEMASKGQLGMKINLDQVPVRDSSIEPEEILLSESQERMLLICEPAKLQEVQNYFKRWGLDAVQIGEVIRERKMNLFWKGERLTSIDPDLLVENAPLYERAYSKWEPKNKMNSLNDLKIKSIELNKWILSELSNAKETSRENIYRQYDQRVGLLTVRGADHDVAMERLPDSKRGLAIAVGCRPHLMKMDVEIGAYDSVFYPALQMSIKGASPIAVTDCLNFGNPEKNEIMSEFVASVEAITASAIALDAPVISGNVSFYNETLGQNIISTPTIGLVGLREHINGIPEDFFMKIGSSVYLISEAQIFSKGLIAEKTNEENIFFGDLKLSALVDFAKNLQKLSFTKGVLSTQMVSRGGLALSLAKMTKNGIGFKTDKKFDSNKLTQEILYQTLFEIGANEALSFEKQCRDLGLKFEKIGTTQADSFVMNDINIKVSDMMKEYGRGFEILA